MFKLSLAQKAGLCLGLIATLPVLSYGQSGYSTNGGPYSVVGSLRGDQINPALSLTSSGGYIVWADNATDGSGLGISAAALDSTLSMVQNPFRVNQRIGADQENPQVSVFPGGGAAFFWQGGLEGYQHIYGRFLSASNTWLGPDVAVSTPTNNFQINPASATLTNGNVIVLWGSYNQFSDSSMQDVYGQMFSPSGGKIGSEFLVNQFTSYNQRAPAVAPLANGGFVAVWVSEQERVQVDTSGSLISGGMSLPSADVYGRIYTADGLPASDEFLINSNLDPCANPRVAAGTDGGFIVVWAEKDLAVVTNGWDIFARAFSSSSPSSAGAIQRINTTIYGDQFLPQISVLGTNYFAVWKSLGPQTIFGQFLNADASPNGGEFQVAANPTIKLMPPALASDNYGQFLAVWTKFTSFAYGTDLYGQRYSGAAAGSAPSLANYGAPASDPFPVDPTIPQPPQLPPQLASGGPVLPAPVAGSPTNGVKGVYSGLFYDTNGVVPSSSGYFTASVTAGGSYSARVTLGKRSYAFSGRLDSTGSAMKTIDRGGALSLMTVQFQVGGEQVLGTIKTTGWLSEIFAYLQEPLAKSAPGLTSAGKYTMIIPPDDNSANSPAGYSYGTVQVDAAGNVRWAGTLADGTKVSQKSAVSKLGFWPLYASLYGGSGSIVSWVQFGTQAGSDLSGAALWQKPSGVPGKTYTAGFTNSVVASGSLYTAPKGGAKALNFSAGTVSFAGPSVVLTNSISLDSHNHISNLAGSKLTLSITPSSGLFHGTVLNTANGKNLSLQGVVLQDSTNGFGLFLNSGQSGSITLTPTP